jgi:16S rRNA (adenine1518-N6/adenine1519-N6)-dimethyltransferase
MPLSPTDTRTLLAQIGIRPRRSLGQNFLVDGNIVRKSVALAAIRPGEAVIEIGPGLGTLTQALLEAGARVWAVETDPALHSYLAATLVPRFAGRFHLVLGDAVEHPLAGFGGGAPFKIVANLPYAIATPWLDAVLGGPLPERMVLMLQQEAARRYTAQPGGKSFGAISVFLQAAYEVERGHKVAADCFYPRPDVESSLLNLARRPSPVAFPAGIKAAIRACFQQRRKQIGSLARDRLPGGGGAWMEHLRCAGLSPRTRPEAIPVALWMRLIPPVSAPACQTGPGALL